MPTLALGDVDIAYELRGDGPLLVLVTGLAGVGAYWNPNIDALARHFTVLTFDQRGTGRSTAALGPYTVELLAGDLVRLLDALGLSHAVLMGHSTGGAIGQVIAGTRPDLVDRLVLYASWATLSPQMRLCFEARRALLTHAGPAAYHRAAPLFLYPPRFVCEAPARIEAEVSANAAASPSPSILDARIEAVVSFDGRRYLRAIAAPTLAVVAADDILTPPVSSHELADGIAGARLEILRHGAHAVSVVEPDAFLGAVLPFLRDERSAVRAVS